MILTRQTLMRNTNTFIETMIKIKVEFDTWQHLKLTCMTWLFASPIIAIFVTICLSFLLIIAQYCHLNHIFNICNTVIMYVNRMWFPYTLVQQYIANTYDHRILKVDDMCTILQQFADIIVAIQWHYCMNIVRFS